MWCDHGTRTRPRCNIQTVLVAAVLALTVSSVAVMEAAAQPYPPDDPPVRTLTVTPADRIELTADRAPLADELATAFAARLELVAVEEADPADGEDAEGGADEATDASGDEDSDAPSTDVWDRLAQCESGGNWSINTGNGFYGGLQFTLDSWQWVGGTGYPHEASRATQIEMAERLLERQGWKAWPVCSRKIGLR